MYSNRTVDFFKNGNYWSNKCFIYFLGRIEAAGLFSQIEALKAYIGDQ
jgi:hypothetical protein